MRIRILKTPPAPVMDGFDVRGFKTGRVYEVDSRIARYLTIAGYAVAVAADAAGLYRKDRTPVKKTRARKAR